MSLSGAAAGKPEFRKEKEAMEQSLLYPVTSKTRRAVSLDGMWRFQFDEKSIGEQEGWEGELPNPVSIPVPSAFADLFTDKKSREYAGDFWYARDFFVPGEWRDKEILLRFGSVTHRAKVFVNGVLVTEHEGGFLRFNAVVTDKVRYDEENRVSVLVNNELS